MALGNLASRFLVAGVAAPVLIGILYYVDAAEATWALVWVATLLAMREFFGMTLAGERDRNVSLALGAVATAALFFLHPGPMRVDSEVTGLALLQAGPYAAIGLAVVPIGIYYLFWFEEMATVASRFVATIAGIVYVGFGLSFLGLVRRDLGEPDLIVLILLIAWIGDTGAYFAGRFLGKKKLYEAVSPKKTWAGAWGGIGGSLLGAVFVKLVLHDALTWVDVVVVSVIGGVLGQLGDLAESLIKRAVGVKDSGSLLPGHGGMLDRIDAVLFIAPWVYVYFALLKPVF
jgi:phosphatidate cytidylyltransferase